MELAVQYQGIVEGDLAVRVGEAWDYLVNPWTALYVGYNTNYRNIELLEQPGGMQQIGYTDSADFNDARQLFVKLSYLFRL